MERPDQHYEKAARKNGYSLVAGIDEAGRGPLAGPVVAAACLLPAGIRLPNVDDSKKLTPEERETLFKKLTTHPKILYGVGVISHIEIDEINIYQATIQAMLQAVVNIPLKPDFLLVDGLQLPHPSIPVQKIIGGDALSLSIAAASIIAKVTRDRLMLQYHAEFPHYGFDRHKGYGTELHLEMIAKYGICPIHRKTFAPCLNKEETVCLSSLQTQ